jgi:hypothetical protein
MYTLAIRWQQQSGLELDELLQVGDLGAFSDLLKLDKATKKHAQKDSDELGFQNFYVATPESQFYLQHSQAPKTYFVRGNHEDFEYLGKFSKPTPIDPWDRFITHLQPRVHLFGHHHQVIYRQDPVSGFLSIGLAHLDFDNGKLKPGSWGILSISPESLSFILCLQTFSRFSIALSGQIIDR